MRCVICGPKNTVPKLTGWCVLEAYKIPKARAKTNKTAPATPKVKTFAVVSKEASCDRASLRPVWALSVIG